jgi:hypothetical protein
LPSTDQNCRQRWKDWGPERLASSVSEQNPVRVMDVFVDELDLASVAQTACCQQRIDGSKSKAVNSSYRYFTNAKLKRSAEHAAGRPNASRISTYSFGI